MATVRIPLVGTFNQRGLDGQLALSTSQDQRFLNCIFNVIENPVTGKKTIYCEKRPGWGVDSVVAAGSASTGLIKPQSFSGTVTAWGETNSTIYLATTNVGTITGRALHFTETIVGTTNYVLIKSSDGTGWYYANDSRTSLTFTGTTHTNFVIDAIASTVGLYAGQLISGAGIVAGTRISSVDSAVAITTDTATTASATITVTKTPIAKILDVDFVTSGVSQSAFAEMDGYLFYVVDTTSEIYNSDLNSVSSYNSINFLPANMAPDPPVAIARHRNTIAVMGGASVEYFINQPGTLLGSPLQRVPQYFSRIGTLDQRGVTTFENEIYFVSSPYEGDIGVHAINNFQDQKVSTPNIDRILGNVSATGGQIYANSFRLGGYSYAAFCISLASDGPASDILLETTDRMLLESASDRFLLEDVSAQLSAFARMMVLNTELKLWTEWDCAQSTFIDSVSNGSANQLIATSRSITDGKIYTIYPSSQGQQYTDDGVAFTMEVRTSKLDFGTTRRKFIRSIRLVCDVDLVGTAYISYSDDDYKTWSTPRAFDLTAKEPKLSNFGSFRGQRAFKITHSSNSNFRAEALEITYHDENEKIRRMGQDEMVRPG